jgi:penicillin-binding protein 1A
VIVSASGRRLFDYSWVYGNIEYRARVSQNGATIKEISSGSSSTGENLESSLAENTETQVCGYYAYSSGISASNEVCSSFVTPKKHVYAPSQGASYDEIMAWADSNGFNIKVSYQVPDDDHPEGTLDLRYNGKTCWGMDVKGASRSFQLNYYTNDFE